MQPVEGFRLSPQQKRLWLLQADQSAAYCAQAVVMIEGALRPDALGAALRQVVERHEILRTTFQPLAGMALPVQLIGEDATPALRSHDLSDHPPHEQETRIAALLEQLAEQHRDLQREPLLRCALARLGPSRHALLVSLPALCADGATLANLMREIARAYAGQPLDEEPIQYADVAELFNEVLESEEGRAGRDHWRPPDPAALGAPALPFEQRGPPHPFAPRCCPLPIAPELATQLAHCAQQYATTVDTLMLACWQILLGRLTGQAEPIVGVAFDGRTYEGLDTALGLFARYLPIGCRLDALTPCSTLLHTLGQELRDSAELQEYFAWGQAAPPPFFPFCFEARRMPAAVTAGDLTLTIERQDACADRFRLKLVCVWREQALSAELHYDPAIYPADEIERLIERFQTLLADLVGRPETPIGAVELVGPAERRQLLAALNATATDPAPERCVHQLFEQQAARTPNALAVVAGPTTDDRPPTTDHRPREGERGRGGEGERDNGQRTRNTQHATRNRLTYAELNARANQLAHYLRSLGVGPETRVALCVERSTAMIVGVLGILKAGGAYVPLDPAYPPERLRYMLEDAQVSVLLTTDKVTRRQGDKVTDSSEAFTLSPPHPLTLSGWSVVDLDADWDQIAQQPKTNLDSGATPDNTAYVIYTSGSTGRPKGVVVQHRSVVNLSAALARLLEDDQAGAPLRFSLNGPLAFDTSVKQLVQLLRGHTLVIVPEAARRDPQALADELRAGQVDVFDCTPTQLKLLLATGQLEQLGPAATRVLVGGEAIDAALWQTLAAIPQRRFFNLYGPTECTVDAAAARIQPGTTAPNIGRPLANMQVYLLDERQRLVPFGLPGELHIGGAGVARGYLGRPELTAERFVPCPWSVVSGPLPGATDNGQLTTDNRLYKTGDLARYRNDGTLEFLGRDDDQVKLRGFRVELGEIESVLRRHPAVQDAVAVLRNPDVGRGEEQPDTQRLVAYVVPSPSTAFTVRQLLRLEREGLLDERMRYQLPNDMTIAQLNKNETEFLYREIFAEQTYLRHGIALEAGACVFDVGANIGLFALFVGLRSPGARIFAFEPIPPVFEVLRTNASLYDFNLVALPYGLADAAGQATFTHYAHASTMSSRYSDADEERAVIRSLILREHATSGEAPLSEELLDQVIAERLSTERFTCRLTTISEMIRRHGVERIDLLKIDAQKSELDVLAGIEAQDWPKIRQLVLEIHDIDGRVEQVRGMLERAGFTVAVEQEQALAGTPLYDLYARRPDSPPATAPTEPSAPAWASPGRLLDDLRRFAGQHLPDYMLPAAFGLLDALPLTPNGKLDRRALPALQRTQPERAVVAPRTPAEAQLAEIWAAVLGLERVGVDDNFFELGGDSILCIQVVARANQAGLQLVPRQMFTHQTLAELAAVAVAAPAQEPAQDEQGPVVGPLPLLPAQRWYFEQPWPDPRAWSHTIRLELESQPRIREVTRSYANDDTDLRVTSGPEGTPFAHRSQSLTNALTPSLLRQALEALLLHHDALRLRFEQDEAGWRQALAEAPATIPFATVDLSGLPQPEQDHAVEQLAAEMTATVDLAAGVLLHAALVDRGPQRPSLLLLATHALAVDGVSRRILAEDLSTATTQLSQGQPIRLPHKTSSLKRWAETLAEYARSEAAQGQLDEWLGHARAPAELPLDLPDTPADPTAAEALSVGLSEQETLALLQDVPAAYRTRIDEVLLTALLLAFQRWTGRDALLLDMRGHGREPIFEGIDLSRTVGWLTSIFPVYLELEPQSRIREVTQSHANKDTNLRAPSGPEGTPFVDREQYLTNALGGIAEPGAALTAVKEQLRRLPDHGMAYGVLRYLGDPAGAGRLAALPAPQVSFNYLGQFDQALADATFTPAPDQRDPAGGLWSPRYLIEVQGGVLGGELRLAWRYNPGRHHHSTIERLAQDFLAALRDLIAHCRSPEAGGYSPSDFPLVNLDQQALATILSQIRTAEE